MENKIVKHARMAAASLSRGSLGVCLALCAALSASCVHEIVAARETPAAALVLDNISIVDTRTGQVRPHMSLTLRGDSITAISPAGSVKAGAGVDVIDGAGRFVVPGYVDAHVHMLEGPQAQDDQALMVLNGITSVRQMSGSSALLEQRAKGLPLTSPLAPRVLAMPGRVMTPEVVFTPEEGVAEVDRQKALGADFIKIGVASSDTFFAIGEEARKQGLPFVGHVPPTVDVLKAVAAGYGSIEHLGAGEGILVGCSTDEDALRAESAARPAIRLPKSPEGAPPNKFIERLLLAPLMANVQFNPRTIARMQRIVETFDDAKCQRMAEQLARSSAWQAPTLIRLRTGNFADDPALANVPFLKYADPAVIASWRQVSADYAAKFSPSDRKTLEAYWTLQLRLTHLLDQAGAHMLAGSDGPGGQWLVSGFSLHQEFAYLAGIGASPLKILQMTTWNPAQFLGLSKTMGSVDVGKVADLVVLDANPVENPANLSRINAVVSKGVYYPRTELDHRLADIAARRD